MDKNFWLERWQQGQIGFHQNQVSPYLLQYWNQLSIPQGRQVFAPLCGKSLDLIWLHQQSYQVLGVEISHKAIEDFFQENQLNPKQTSQAPFQSWKYETINLLQGDFFDISPKHLHDGVCVYDRAALVALPKEMRQAYVKHISRLLTKGSKVFLVTMVYPQDKMDGPPFSVTGGEVMELYGADFRLIEKYQHNILDGHRFKERGIEYLYEEVYLLEKK